MTPSKIIIPFVLIALILFSGCIEILKDGKHSGQITAIEKNGLIWKTNSVYVKSDISSSQEDRYCVENESLLPLLDNLSKSRQQVTVLYRGEIYVAPWRCSFKESGSIITGVEINP